MISAISQIEINQPSYIKKKNCLFGEKFKQDVAEKKDAFENEKQVKIEKEKKENLEKSKYMFLSNFLLSTIAVSAISVLLFNMQKKKGNTIDYFIKGSFKFKSLKDKKNIPTVEKCKSLNQNLKDLLNKQIKISKADKELLEEVGNPNASNRFLLSGPTGAGKTYFSKVYAKTLNADYVEILFSDLNSRWVGEVEQKISSMFNDITNQALKSPNKKFVVTFNEIDSLLSPIEHLTGGNGSTYFVSLRRERSVFLTHLEKLQKEAPNVTVIGTTNMSPNSKNLDNAILGRFQNIIEVPYPDSESLYEGIKMGLEKIKNKDTFIKENDEKLKELAKNMAERKFSFRNLDFIVNEAKSAYLRDKIDNKNATFNFEYLKQSETNIRYSDGEREFLNSQLEKKS